jgi:GWxTD domain-containing protein
LSRSDPFHGLTKVWESVRPSRGYVHSTCTPRTVLLAILLVVAALDAGRSAPKPQLSAAHKAWLEEEVVYIITAMERSVFLKLQTDRERELFIEAFWRQRDPTPGTPENEFKTEHFRRIAHATRALGRDTSRPGWKTDRGRIYIILGEPQDIERFEGRSSTYDTEVWFYQGKTDLGLPPAFYVVFFKALGSGEFRLYSPIADGPQALMPGYLGDLDPKAAYEKLREIEPNLAEVSLSLVPDEAGTVYGKPSMTADLLIQRIASAPARSVKSQYAQKFLAYKDVVEVEYTANYIDNASLIKVFKDPSGPYFVHYAVQPQRLSVNQRDSMFFTTLKVNGRVSAAGGQLVYQFDKSVPLNLTAAQMDEANRVPFDLQDLFPLVGGDYTLSLLIKNEASKEFTSVEQTLRIPEAGKAVQMTQPLLGYRAVRLEPAARKMKAFRVGAYQVFCQPDLTFSRQEALAVAFQVHNLTGDAAAAAEIKLEFLKDGQPVRTIVRKPSEYADLPDVLEEVSLSDFAPAHYALKVAVGSGGAEIVSATEEFDVSFAERLPRPWFFSRLLPAAGDPAYSGIIGLQLFNLGRLAEAQTLLESVFARLPGSEEAAAALARVYVARGAASDAVRILAPFIDPARTPKYETFVLAAQALRRARELEGAVAALERAVERYGINAALMNLMGECLAELGKIPEALAAFEKSLTLSPDQPSVRARIDELKKRK